MFNICVIIILLYLLWQVQKLQDNKEPFADVNMQSINDYNNLAKSLTAGGHTVPGNMMVNGTTTMKGPVYFSRNGSGTNNIKGKDIKPGSLAYGFSHDLWPGKFTDYMSMNNWGDASGGKVTTMAMAKNAAQPGMRLLTTDFNGDQTIKSSNHQDVVTIKDGHLYAGGAPLSAVKNLKIADGHKLEFQNHGFMKGVAKRLWLAHAMPWCCTDKQHAIIKNSLPEGATSVGVHHDGTFRLYGRMNHHRLMRGYAHHDHIM